MNQLLPSVALCVVAGVIVACVALLVPQIVPQTSTYSHSCLHQPHSLYGRTAVCPQRVANHFENCCRLQTGQIED